MFCRECGQENHDQANSCVKCGRPLGAEVSPQHAEVLTTNAPSGIAPAQQPAVIMPIEPQTDRKAVASLVFGILGVLTAVLLIGILLGIPAVVFGHLSSAAIKNSMGRLKGAGMALTGLIMGYISLSGVLIIVAIALPGLRPSRIAANEAAAVSYLRTIAVTSSTYRVNKASYPATLKDLNKAELIDSQLGSGTKSGYRFTYTSTNDHFLVTAVPLQPGATGTRNFCAGEDNIVRVTKGEECTPDSPAL